MLVEKSTQLIELSQKKKIFRGMQLIFKAFNLDNNKSSKLSLELYLSFNV
ncbi:MAG: hypothetical protein JGK31_07615 [Microcoleus sp. PH2017_30_WIL_O_A]|nr:hypothetical protein [Microcoleus sp. PH2017_30_WIL_O_A]